jgi:hypothetical protein
VQGAGTEPSPSSRGEDRADEGGGRRREGRQMLRQMDLALGSAGLMNFLPQPSGGAINETSPASGMALGQG